MVSTCGLYRGELKFTLNWNKGREKNNLRVGQERVEVENRNKVGQRNANCHHFVNKSYLFKLSVHMAARSKKTHAISQSICQHEMKFIYFH